MQISISLVALTGSFETDMNRAAKTTERRMKEIQRNVEQVAKVIGAALVAATTAIAVGIKGAIDRADELSKAAQKIGIATESLSRLAYAADLSDVSLEQLQTGLARLTKFQAEAAQGGKEQIRVFEQLGIAIKDASGHLRDTESVLKDFANVFASLPDGPEKTALALEVFGRSGAELIPLLNQGAAGIRQAGDELERFGGVLSGQAGVQAEEFNDNLRRLQVQVESLFLAVANDLLPDLVELTAEFSKNSSEGDKAASTAASIADGIRKIGAACLATVDLVQSLTSGIIGFTESVAKFMQLNPGVLLARLSSGGAFNGAFGGDPGEAFAMAQEEFNQARGRFASGGSSAPTGFGRGIRGGGGRGFSGASPNGTPRDISGLFTAASKAARGHKEEVDKVAEAYERMKAQMAEQIALFGDTTEVAKVRYEIEHGELAKLSAAKKQELLDQAAMLDLLGEEADEKKRLNDLEKERLETIQRAHEALEGTLSDLQFEIDLLGKSNAERIAEIELRRIGIGLTEQEREAARQAIESKAEELRALQDQVAAMDEMRSSFEDIFFEVATGQKSLIDGLKAFADAFVQQLIRMAAAQASTALFGEPGTTGGGLLGGIFSAIFGGLSGGNPFAGRSFATGTDFAPGGWSLVGEKGPELVNLPRGAQVVPNHRIHDVAGGGDTFIFNDTYSAPTDARTREQVSKDKARQLQLAKARA